MLLIFDLLLDVIFLEDCFIGERKVFWADRFMTQLHLFYLHPSCSFFSDNRFNILRLADLHMLLRNNWRSLTRYRCPNRARGGYFQPALSDLSLQTCLNTSSKAWLSRGLWSLSDGRGQACIGTWLLQWTFCRSPDWVAHRKHATGETRVPMLTQIFTVYSGKRVLRERREMPRRWVSKENRIVVTLSWWGVVRLWRASLVQDRFLRFVLRAIIKWRCRSYECLKAFKFVRWLLFSSADNFYVTIHLGFRGQFNTMMVGLRHRYLLLHHSCRYWIVKKGDGLFIAKFRIWLQWKFAHFVYSQTFKRHFLGHHACY